MCFTYKFCHGSPKYYNAVVHHERLTQQSHVVNLTSKLTSGNEAKTDTNYTSSNSVANNESYFSFL